MYLEKGNPYTHFNDEKSSCYMRLWELEGGDDAEFGQAFAGGRDGAGWNSDDESTDEDDDDDDGNVAFAHAADIRVPAARPQPPPAPVAPQPAPRANGQGDRPAGNNRNGARGDVAPPALRAFLEMARRDAEDEWDSDEMSGDEEDDFGG